MSKKLLEAFRSTLKDQQIQDENDKEATKRLLPAAKSRPRTTDKSRHMPEALLKGQHQNAID